MCGVLGLYSRSIAFDPSVIERALPTLLHRGPDAQTSWASPSRRVVLGHTRLSIIGLQNGSQPLANESGRIHAVVNGELYGFESIRDELRAKGHTFKTESDSEILLHLYEEMGTACLSRMRGEFAFILWDESNQTLFAGRDRFGIKPLFYARRGNQIYLASEIKALLAMGVEAKWDHETVHQHHSGVSLPNRTLIEGVYSVPPGHFLFTSGGEVRLIPYWDFDYPRVADAGPAPSFEESVKSVRSRIEESVRLRMRSDVPVGVYLSGGIDSCSILGFASRMSSQKLRAFTLCFDDEGYNEFKIAEEMAAHAGAEFNPIPMTGQDLADHFTGAVSSAETLMTNGHGVAKYLLSRRVNQAGIRVVLTGEGSDEIFGGYAPFKQDMILHNASYDAETRERLLAELHQTNAASKVSLLTRESSNLGQAVRQALGFVPSFLEAFLSAGAKLRPLFNPEFLAPFADRDPTQALMNEIDVRRQLEGREPLHQSMYLWSKTTLPLYLLTVLGDRMEMAHSVEGRVPFLDHELAQALVRLPADYKIKGLTEKHILKEAARPVLTETVYRRQKHPFLAPPSTKQDKNPLEQFCQDTLRSADGLDSLPFYSKKNVLHLLDALPDLGPDQRLSIDPLLMMLTSSAVLRKLFRIA